MACEQLTKPETRAGGSFPLLIFFITMKNKYINLSLPDYVIESLDTLSAEHPINAGKTEAMRKAFGFTDERAPLLVTEHGALALYVGTCDDGLEISIALNYVSAGVSAPGTLTPVKNDQGFNVSLAPVDKYREENGLPPIDDAQATTE